MRTLTDATIAAATADSSRPYCLLQVAWPAPGNLTAPILIAPGEPTVPASTESPTTAGGTTLPPVAPIGTMWYAQEDFGLGDGSTWDNAQGRVLEWGVVRFEMKQDKSANVVGDCTIKLRDEDKAIWRLFQQVEPQRTWVAIYQQFRGNAQADLVKVHEGIINAPCTWSEKDHAVLLDITDISTYFNRTIGNIADRLDYPDVTQTDENKMIPLVFGKVKRAKAVALGFGPVTTLARICRPYDGVLFVNDSEFFPQLTAMQIWVGGERINGQFDGNAFIITARGGPVYTGTVTALGANCQQIVDTVLTGADGAWVGYYLLFTTPDGNAQRKIIQGYDASTHTITFGMDTGSEVVNPYNPTDSTWLGDPLFNHGAAYTVPIGATYQIGTCCVTHANGTKVYVARSNYTYVVNDAPSTAVRVVEGYGHPILNSENFVWSFAPTEWYVPLSPLLYTVNLNDQATCPGRSVTSITFPFPPSTLDFRLNNDDLWVTLDGVESNGDSTGTVLENPSDIIWAIHRRWMGMTLASLDAASFLAAEAATAPLKMAFALTEQKKGLELCADLAFQARCSEVFFAGQAELIYLTNVMTPAGTPPTSGADRYLGSLDIARREWNQIVTEITGSYIDNAVRRTVILRSPAAEQFVGGRVAKTIDFWAYNNLAPVQGVANFWLNRWQYIWQQIALVDSLRRLDAEPYDVLQLDLAGWFGAGQIARVVGIEQTLGGGSSRATPGIKLNAEIPYFPSGVCDTLAEAMPEVGCWACETSCQVGCELFCTTQYELNGPVNNTTASESGAPSTHEGTAPPSTEESSTGPETSSGPTEEHTPGPTEEHTPGPTEEHTSGPTEEHTTGPTSEHTAGPTEPHTTGPTSPHTSPHTAPHTGPHTSGPTSPPTSPPPHTSSPTSPPPPHTSPPTSPPTRPPTSPPTHPPTSPPTRPPTSPPTSAPTGAGCTNCTGKTPASIHLTSSNGVEGTLDQAEHSPCNYSGSVAGPYGTATAAVELNSWEVVLRIYNNATYNGEGTYAPPSTDGKYNCMATYAVNVARLNHPSTIDTYTLVPS